MTAEEVRCEKIKLRASFINSLAVGVFIAGVLSPIVTLTLREDSSEHALPLAVILSALCFVISFILHLRAVEHLSELGQ